MAPPTRQITSMPGACSTRVSVFVFYKKLVFVVIVYNTYYICGMGIISVNKKFGGYVVTVPNHPLDGRQADIVLDGCDSEREAYERLKGMGPGYEDLGHYLMVELLKRDSKKRNWVWKVKR